MKAAEPKVHVFEAAGLGKAPFTCLGIIERRGPITLEGGTQVGAPGQPMGCCKFCYTGIAECYVVRSADGQTFDVGSECVRKTGDAGLRKTVNEHERKKRQAREAAKVAELRELMLDPEVLAKLSEHPHPIKLRADEGETLAGWASWMLCNAGTSGRLRVLRRVKAALAGGGQ